MQEGPEDDPVEAVGCGAVGCQPVQVAVEGHVDDLDRPHDGEHGHDRQQPESGGRSSSRVIGSMS